MNEEEFIKICNDHKFWQWVKNKSLVPYQFVLEKKEFLSHLFKSILNRTYYPSPPLEYLTINKGNSVVRIIPVLTLDDLCVFYYCVRKLEKYIAVNHVAGTYGGFGLSGSLREVEEKVLNEIKQSNDVVLIDDKYYMFDVNPYGDLSAMNAKAWFAEWSDFTKKIYFSSANYNYKYVAELDISNFYDSIQLDHLEYKLREAIPNENNEVIYLLLHFLKFWNRHINFYRQQGAGIPQDLFGECSRVLANFYLQKYDKRMSTLCMDYNAMFFRYADDQVIFAETKEELNKIIAKASSLLMREGLNFNQKKVRIMAVEEFQNYFAFENFFQLVSDNGAPPTITMVEEQIDFYLSRYKVLRKSGQTLLRTILNIINRQKFRPCNLPQLKELILNKDFFLENFCTLSDFNKIYQVADEEERNQIIEMLLHSVETCLFTSRLYNVKLFFEKHSFSTTVIDARIIELNSFYNFNTPTH